MRDLGIFTPSYEAALLLPETIARLPEEVWARTAVLWVVDDGSSDDTPRVTEGLLRTYPRLRVHRFPENRGYGAAVLEGLARVRHAGVARAVCLHADGQYPPERVPALLAALDRGLDLVQGSRHAGGGALSGGMPFYKYAAGKLLTALESAVFGLRLTDYHSGMIAYGPRALAGIPFAALSGSFDFDLEAIACARAAGLRIGEVPIPTRYAGEESHLNPVTYGLRCLRTMGRFLSGRYAGLVRASRS